MNADYRPRLLGLLALMTSSLLVGLCPVSLLAAEAPAAQPIDGKIKWVYDYEQGKRLSQQTGKPMFVVFRCER